MDAFSVQRHQEIMASQSLDTMLESTNHHQNQQQEQQQQQQQQLEKKPRPAEQALKCPRCDSTNTKFCYYNNYSLSQPRYFCKSCRRYWTKGGTLRNVPVGGGCRKNKRSSSSSRRSTPDHHLQVSLITTPSSSPISSSQPLISPYDHHHHHSNNNNNPPSSTDLALAFAHGNISILGNHGNSHFDLFGNVNPNGINSFLDTLSNGTTTTSLQHLYYGGLGGNNVNVRHEDHHQMGMKFEHNYHHNYNNNQEIMSNASSGSSTPTIKQELGESKVLWSFPWQIHGEGNYNINGGGSNEFDSSLRESWNNGVLGSSWNNLLNSPLM